MADPQDAGTPQETTVSRGSPRKTPEDAGVRITDSPPRKRSGSDIVRGSSRGVGVSAGGFSRRGGGTGVVGFSPTSSPPGVRKDFKLALENTLKMGWGPPGGLTGPGIRNLLVHHAEDGKFPHFWCGISNLLFVALGLSV
jgi:hypothetical protein